jgi:transcriptional regulator with PAS, ATPase and Fis domain
LPVDDCEAMTLEARVGAAERQVICESLSRHDHHRIATAKELGISRVTLYNKMKKFGMLA